jgi:hypothetical protein
MKTRCLKNEQSEVCQEVAQGVTLAKEALAIDARLHRQRVQGGQDHLELNYILSVHFCLLGTRALEAPKRCKAVLLLSHKVSFMYT